ncbi:MAG TPA: hypothetical protein VFC53_05130 [Dehalococcoidia bacterium]|nr:hypothetical protein [Dehalococcoidia bacterium]
MRPYPEELLRILQTGVMAHFAPEVQSTYGRAQIAFSMLLFGVAQRDYDSAVPDLLEANRALREMLDRARTALDSVPGEEAAAASARLATLPAPAATPRLSALRTEFDGLRAAICELAPLLERAADDDALAPLREARGAIYDWLAADARRRVVPILSA